MSSFQFIKKSYCALAALVYQPMFTVLLFYFSSCVREIKIVPPAKPAEIKRIAGSSESIPADSANKGEALISYSDCFQCHAKEKKLVGPAFADIAKRYPANDTFITMLSQRIISGGNGVWGSPAMAPHPKISRDDARLMVKYILSLNQHLEMVQ
jgi:cytochrome c